MKTKQKLKEEIERGWEEHSRYVLDACLAYVSSAEKAKQVIQLLKKWSVK